MDPEAVGYAVAWQREEQWRGLMARMGYQQQAYDAECAAIARALETAVRWPHVPKRAKIYTDA